MLIKGNELNAEVRREVLNAFGYRWTFENIDRARRWIGDAKCPSVAPVSDVEWLFAHAFHVTKDRKYLMRNRHHAVPAFMAETAIR